VDISCPQCAAAYRVTSDLLDEKIECTECHRVFFAKSTVGKRVTAPDHTKTYIGFGVAAVAIIALFVLSNSGPKAVKKAAAPKKVEVAPYGRSDHPRALGLQKWSKSLASNNQLVLATHTDMEAIAELLGVVPKSNSKSESSSASSNNGVNPTEVMAALISHKSTELLRTMDCTTMLETDADMTAASGNGFIYVTPKTGDDRFKRNTRGTFTVTFKADGNNIKVSSFAIKQKPVYLRGKDPSKTYFTGNKDIARPDEVEITDSAGTRKVSESKPAAVPHWAKATPEQRALADEVVAGILAAAVPDAPGALFNRATLKVRGPESTKAAVPRVLNAMFESYSDVITNHQKLILLDRALYQWTGYAVNYPARPTGNDEADTKRRQSCIRQWFGHWYRYHDNLEAFIDSAEDLDDEGGGNGGK
jgi:DNA-directed RNA polymerase subunit RPC12/RpoP